jgi:hypothetical protein
VLYFHIFRDWSSNATSDVELVTTNYAEAYTYAINKMMKTYLVNRCNLDGYLVKTTAKKHSKKFWRYTG